MNKLCYSCAAPLNLPNFAGPSEHYCRHCTDKDGHLKPREEILRGVAQWLQSWQPDLSAEKATIRAEHYLQAMPAWAD